MPSCKKTVVLVLSLSDGNFPSILVPKGMPSICRFLPWLGRVAHCPVSHSTGEGWPSGLSAGGELSRDRPGWGEALHHTVTREGPVTYTGCSLECRVHAMNALGIQETSLWPESL